MKLLFDHNLPPRLAKHLNDIFPGSSHVSLHGLEREEDVVVWEFARVNQFLLVTKDADFNDLNTLRGFPPKVVWIRIGNCSTIAVETLLRQHQDPIDKLETDETIGILLLS